MNFVKSEVEHLSETKYEYINKDIKALKEELYRSFATKEDLIPKWKVNLFFGRSYFGLLN